MSENPLTFLRSKLWKEETCKNFEKIENFSKFQRRSNTLLKVFKHVLNML